MPAGTPAFPAPSGRSEGLDDEKTSGELGRENADLCLRDRPCISVEPPATVASLMKIELERRESSMTAQDPVCRFQGSPEREAWSLFTPMEVFTTPAAAKLANFAGVAAGQRLLDVGCGTGVVAITAARRGAKVGGLDLSPVLIARAREHAGLVNLDVDFKDGDAESLPYGDSEFDVVLSQFGHMFAPRPDVTIAEMLRVLKPGGTIAFSTGRRISMSDGCSRWSAAICRRPRAWHRRCCGAIRRSSPSVLPAR